MKCIHCGAEIGDGQLKCNYCGKEQRPDVQPQQPVQNAGYPQSAGYPQPAYGAPMYNQGAPGYYYNGGTYALLILSIIAVIGCIGACFLPYFSAEGLSLNYVYWEITEDIKDGAIIVALSGVSLLLLFFKKKIPVFILQLISVGVFAYDYFDSANKGISNDVYGIGFYILLVALITSVVLSLVRLCMGHKAK